MLLEREPLNTFMEVSFFNKNIKNNVIMVIIVIVIIILRTMIIIIIIIIMITIIIMIITHKDSELIYSICILYVRYPTHRRRNGERACIKYT